MKRVDPEMTRRARALRADATRAERTMWRLLSRYRPKFTRQLVEGPFILDLACRAARLAVEIDGGQHADNRRDAARTTWLESEGWTVIRFWNKEPTPNPSLPGRGEKERRWRNRSLMLGGSPIISNLDLHPATD